MQPFYWRKNINDRSIYMRLAFAILITVTAALTNYQIQAQESRTSSNKIIESKNPNLTSRLLQLLKKCQNFNQKISPRTSFRRNIGVTSEKKIIAKKPSLSIVSTKKAAVKSTKSTNRKVETPKTTSSVSSKSSKSNWSFIDFFF